MQLNPARGRKLDNLDDLDELDDAEVYAAQPREGTETSNVWRGLLSLMLLWFMQLNPARGRKLEGFLL